MPLRRVILSSLFVTLAVFAQAPRTSANSLPARPKPVAPAHSSAQPRLSDSQIEADIRARLARSKKISLDKFQVHVQGGIATFEGRTDVVQHKGSATRMAKSAGAVAVNNRIVVSEAARLKSAGNLEEGRRRAQIKRGEARSVAR